MAVLFSVIFGVALFCVIAFFLARNSRATIQADAQAFAPRRVDSEVSSAEPIAPAAVSEAIVPARLAVAFPAREIQLPDLPDLSSTWLLDAACLAPPLLAPAPSELQPDSRDAVTGKLAGFAMAYPETAAAPAGD